MISFPSLAASCMDRMRIGLADARAEGMRVTRWCSLYVLMLGMGLQAALVHPRLDHPI